MSAQPNNWRSRAAAFLRCGARHPFAVVLLLVLAGLGLAGWRVGWDDLWLTPDQRGRLLMARGAFEPAADAFRDPMWRGVALMRAGDFKAAAQAFAGIDTAPATFDLGNALVMLGRYDDAVGRYDRALELRPGWADAEVNRGIARLRAQRMKTEGGDTGDDESSPDQVVFDKDKTGGKADAPVAGKGDMSDEAIRSLWLKRVQTRPADFLRAKFAYQLQAQQAGSPHAPEARP